MPAKKATIIILALFCSFLSIAQEKAYPKSGDAVQHLLKRYNRTGPEAYEQFIDLNKNRLGKNHSLIMGKAYSLPPLPGKKTATASHAGYEPLFGKALASYTITSSELKGASFYLVSGHGGPDPGAIGKMGSAELHEDEYAYDIILRLARNLLTKGARVYIIIQDPYDGIRDDKFLKNSKKETCIGKIIPLNQVQRLEQRSAKINELNRKDPESYKRALFVHIDSRSKSRQTDVYFYHSLRGDESKHLAKTLRNTFSNKYKKHQPGRGFSGTIDKRSLYVLNRTTPPAVFVELGNIQNSDDQKRFILSDNRQALANWLCEGFIEDYRHYRKK